MQCNRTRRRIGMLTPSSNTALEPMATEILRSVPQVSVHVSRLRVTEISLDDAALHQFDLDAHLRAAELLADARVDVIGWNGTSASWTGFEGDERLCAEIERIHGVAATTAVLAINELLEILEGPAFRSRVALHRHGSAEDHRNLQGTPATNASPSATSKSGSTTHSPTSRSRESRRR